MEKYYYMDSRMTNEERLQKFIRFFNRDITRTSGYLHVNGLSIYCKAPAWMEWESENKRILLYVGGKLWKDVQKEHFEDLRKVLPYKRVETETGKEYGMYRDEYSIIYYNNISHLKYFAIDDGWKSEYEWEEER